METSFICVARSIRWTHDDYWRTEHDVDDDAILESETLEGLYEKIAQYKIAYEKPQAAPMSWWSKGSNWNDYTEVQFGAIYEIVRNWDNFDPGESIDQSRILNSQTWQKKLADENAAEEARKEAARAEREAKAEKKAKDSEESLERQHRRMKFLERRAARRNA